ncbi:hypothetical protein [Streptomyces boncukensis]|uniref:Uncharacterized protein n=1 Tax=Streptomyces boncukensis TaxID=2711219 RepID=A0A6G4X9F7_9ACTN|nr:hypothetical protein [Streptomyces boncukensis]NGO73384.1 hypothetical protein [Streptomyces boncukensis]
MDTQQSAVPVDRLRSSGPRRPAVEAVPAAWAPELRARIDYRPLWPRFLFAAPSMRLYRPLAARWPYAQLLLVSPDSGALLGWLDTAPAHWDGTDAGLPGGWDDLMRRAVRGLRAGRRPDTLAMMSLSVLPAARGAGLGRTAIELTRALAGRLGLRAVLAPVRPTAKCACPHVPMADYARRRRADGWPEDPWLRTHLRAGGRTAGVAEQSTVLEAPLGDWAGWGASVPRSAGERAFTVAGALAPVRVTRLGTGRYVEPNVWVIHSPSAATGKVHRRAPPDTAHRGVAGSREYAQYEP